MAPTKTTARPGIAALLAVGFAAQGCGVHVQLPTAPDRAAPIAHRYGFYQAHRPAALQTTTRYMVNQFGMVTGTSTSLDAMVLANGTSVQYPEDLHPLVDPESPTAQSAERARRSRGLATGLIAGGVTGMILGAALMIPAFSSSYGSDYSSSDRGVNSGMLWTSVGLMLAGTVTYFVGLFGPNATASQERANAFAGLDASLRARVGLCGYGEQIIDCASQSPVVPMPQPAPQLQPMQPTQPAPWAAPPPPAAPTPAVPTPAAPVTPVTL